MDSDILIRLSILFSILNSESFVVECIPTDKVPYLIDFLG